MLIKYFSKPALYWLIILLVFDFILHVPVLNRPPSGIHVWRQCNTLAVARNFYEEGMNIFKPRVDRRLDTNGITGMQFPLYEWIVAAGYKIFGFSDWMARDVNFLIFSFCLIGIYKLFCKWFHSTLLAAIASWACAFSPELFYYSVVALPDVLALCCMVWFLVFFFYWKNTFKNKNLFLSILFLLIAGLVKIQFLSALVPASILVYILFKKNKIDKIKSWIFFSGVLATVVIVLSWYYYSLKLIAQSGLHDFGIEMRPETNLQNAIPILIKNIISDLPELLLNYASFILFCTGLYIFFKNKKWKHTYSFALGIWVFVLVIYHLLELKQMRAHQYYMLSYIVLLLIPVVLGAQWLYNKNYIVVLNVLLIAIPIAAIIRIYPARWMKPGAMVPIELYSVEKRTDLINAAPQNQLCITGPDESGCIYFYFLHKKGFGFDNAAQLLKTDKNNKSALENYISRGAEYLYTDDEQLINKPEVINHTEKQLQHLGKFYVIKLK